MAELLSSDQEVQDAHPHTVYDLMANICHDGQPGGLNLHMIIRYYSFVTCNWEATIIIAAHQSELLCTHTYATIIITKIIASGNEKKLAYLCL